MGETELNPLPLPSPSRSRFGEARADPPKGGIILWFLTKLHLWAEYKPPFRGEGGQKQHGKIQTL